MSGEWTHREILQQFASWKLLREHLRADIILPTTPTRHVLMVGCGSSLWAATWGAWWWSSGLAIQARALPASLLWRDPEMALDGLESPLLLALSRTGETTEVLEAIASYRRVIGTHGTVWGLTCEPTCRLVEASDRAIILPVQERSVVTTSAQTSSLLALWDWARQNGCAVPELPGDREIDIQEARFHALEPRLAHLSANESLTHLVILGSGADHAIAAEAALKFREMALDVAVEALPTYEVRHGYRAVVGASTLAIWIEREGEEAVLADLVASGATGLIIGERVRLVTAAGEEDWGPWSDARGPWRGVCALPLMHALAYHRALHRGLDPDSPRQLTRTVLL